MTLNALVDSFLPQLEKYENERVNLSCQMMVTLLM